MTMKVEIINCAMNGQTIQRNLKILGRGNIENNQGVRSKTCSRNELINEVGKERWYHGWYIFLLRFTTWDNEKKKKCFYFYRHLVFLVQLTWPKLRTMEATKSCSYAIHWWTTKGHTGSCKDLNLEEKNHKGYLNYYTLAAKYWKEL